VPTGDGTFAPNERSSRLVSVSVVIFTLDRVLADRQRSIVASPMADAL
jgi:hypothetical protein